MTRLSRISTKKSSSIPTTAKYTAPPVLQPKATKKSPKPLPEWKPGGSGTVSPLQRLIDAKAAQTKLTIGQPNDKYEQEKEGTSQKREGERDLKADTKINQPMNGGNRIQRFTEHDESSKKYRTSDDGKMMVEMKTQNAWAAKDVIREAENALKRNNSPISVRVGKKFQHDKIKATLLYEVIVFWRDPRNQNLINKVNQEQYSVKPGFQRGHEGDRQRQNKFDVALIKACGGGYWQISGGVDNEQVCVGMGGIYPLTPMDKKARYRVYVSQQELIAHPEEVAEKIKKIQAQEKIEIVDKDYEIIQPGVGLVVTRTKKKLDQVDKDIKKWEQSIEISNINETIKQKNLEKLRLERTYSEENANRIDVLNDDLNNLYVKKGQDKKKRFGNRGLNHHFAYVLMNSGNDYVTLETHTYKNTWDFLMYTKGGNPGKNDNSLKYKNKLMTEKKLKESEDKGTFLGEHQSYYGKDAHMMVIGG